MSTVSQTNFGFLQRYTAQAARLGMLAEKDFPDDPNRCLLKLRQMAERLRKRRALR